MSKFLTPCFVRVSDPAERKELIEWLKSVGYRIYGATNAHTVVTDASIGGAYFGRWSAHGRHDCGTSIPLFRALAAMNDSNDREQWFIEDIHKLFGIGGQTVGLEPTRKVGEKWFKYEGNDLRVTNHIVFEKENSYHGYCSIRKATAKEIIEHFKNQQP